MDEKATKPAGFEIEVGKVVKFDKIGPALNDHISAVMAATGIPFVIQNHLRRIKKALLSECQNAAETRNDMIKTFGAEVMKPVIIDGKQVLEDGPAGDDDGQATKIEKMEGTGAWSVIPSRAEEFTEELLKFLQSKITVNVSPLRLAQLGERVNGTSADDLEWCESFLIPED